MIRTGYLLIGLLLGVWSATSVALPTLIAMDKDFDREFRIAMLTGMSEGWERGRDAEYKRIMWMVYECLEQKHR